MSQSGRRVNVIIDGMTGVGKTAMVKLLSGRLGLTPFDEIFRDRYDILRKFYHDRKKWAFPMQVMFLINRFRQFCRASELGEVVMDRSIYSDPIFARMYYESGYMTEEEYGIYRQLLESFLEQIRPPLLMVYLRAEFKEALRRIRMRGRDDELAVEPEYWRKLWDFYEQNYRSYQASPLLVLDVTGMDYVHNPQDSDQLVARIEEALDNARRRQSA